MGLLREYVLRWWSRPAVPPAEPVVPEPEPDGGAADWLEELFDAQVALHARAEADGLSEAQKAALEFAPGAVADDAWPDLGGLGLAVMPPGEPPGATETRETGGAGVPGPSGAQGPNEGRPERK